MNFPVAESTHQRPDNVDIYNGSQVDNDDEIIWFCSRLRGIRWSIPFAQTSGNVLKMWSRWWLCHCWFSSMFHLCDEYCLRGELIIRNRINGWWSSASSRGRSPEKNLWRWKRLISLLFSYTFFLSLISINLFLLWPFIRLTDLILYFSARIPTYYVYFFFFCFYLQRQIFNKIHFSLTLSMGL